MKKVFTLLLMSFACTVFAGDFKLGKVSKEELEEKVHPTDPSAHAAVLYKKGNTYFDIDGERWVIITEVEVRMKIYSKEGYKHANVSIPYYYKRINGESVTFSDAATYNLVNGEIEKTTLKKDDNYTEEVSSTRREKKIMLANVKEGSVIEYKYVHKSPYIHNFPDWYFQERIPVNFVEYSVNIPQLFVYNRIINSYYKLQENVEVNKRSVYDRMVKVTFQEIKQKYSIENLPAFKTEKYIDNADNYRLFVKHELASAKDLNEKETKYTTTWQSVVKTLYTDEDFGGELKKESYFRDDIDALISGVQDNDSKIKLVFNYVKNRMNWSGRYGFFCSEGVKKAYDERSGSSAEINLMLTAMLRYAGLNANPILLSTRDNGYASYISLGAYNYVIAGVELNGKTIVLDATDKFSSVGILPVRDLNGSGWLLKDDYTWFEVKLNPIDISRKNIFLTCNLDADGSLTGKISGKYYDYEAFMYKKATRDISHDQHIQRIEKNLGNLEVSNLEFEDSEETTAQVTFDFKASGYAESVGDKIYLSPLLFYSQDKNSFDEKERLYPLDFVYPSQSRYNIVITIPDGYIAESLPDPIRLASADGILDFSYRVGNSENKIQLLVVRSENYATVDSGYYASLKEMQDMAVKKQTEKIVLRKK